MIERICVVCKKIFYIYPSRLIRNPNEGKFCSNKCRSSGKNNPNYKGLDTWKSDTFVCKFCHKTFKVSRKYSLKRKIGFCSVICSQHFHRGINSPIWMGGRKMAGYFYRNLPTHPFCNSDGYIAEHRLVMEKHLGRYLDKSEVIHHINGDKMDNRIENLKVLSPSEHTILHNVGRIWSGDKEAQSRRMVEYRKNHFWSTRK